VLAIRNSLASLAMDLTGIDFQTTPHDRVATLLQSLQLDAADLEAFGPFDSARYTRHLIFRNAAFELLLLHWPRGAQSAIHDHGNQHGYMAVKRGSLIVDDFVLLSGGKQAGPAQIAPAGSTTMPAGGVDIRTSMRDLHRVAPADGEAISIHVYAKPIDEFLIFNQAQRSCQSIVSRYDSTPTDRTNDGSDR
jgi:cysteine dioxygenase